MDPDTLTPAKCVYNTSICDGEKDCEDGTDEMNCSKYACTLQNLVQCIYVIIINDDELVCFRDICAK